MAAERVIPLDPGSEVEKALFDPDSTEEVFVSARGRRFRLVPEREESGYNPERLLAGIDRIFGLISNEEADAINAEIQENRSAGDDEGADE